MSADAPPLLVAREARVAVDGVVTIDRLTLSTVGDRVLLAGDPGALLSALMGVPLSASGAMRTPTMLRGAAPPPPQDDELPGEALVVGGELLLAGHRVADGAHIAARGAAPLDPPLPAGWTAEDYVAWSARLTGASRSAARDLAHAALARLGLSMLRKRAATSLALPERRALVLAQAIVTAPEVLVAEAPLRGLEGAAFAFVLRAVAAATEGRRAVLSASRIDPASLESTLARGASHLVILAGGELAVEGTPAELFAAARLYRLTVLRNADALRDELAARGLALQGGPTRFSVALPENATSREIIAAAKAASAAIVEMVPVIA